MRGDAQPDRCLESGLNSFWPSNSRAMRIALATCSNLPSFEVDDRPLIDALEARGAEVHRPSWDDRAVDWRAMDACLIRTTWDYMDRCDEFVAWAERAASLTKLFNSSAVVRWNTDKRYLRELEEDGVACVPTLWLDRGTAPDVGAMARERGWDRAFLKPTVGASASGTFRFETDAAGVGAATEHLAELLPEQSFMLQPYLHSVETAGELSAVIVDGQLTHGVRKVPVKGDYRVQDDYGATDELFEFAPDESALSHRIVDLASERLGERGLLYARVDYLRSEDGELLLNELELVEPSMFFRHAPEAAAALATSLLARLES